MSMTALTGEQVAKAGLDGWARLMHYGLFRLNTRIHTDGFATGCRLVGAIGRAAQELDHHAELDLRQTRVDVRLDSGYDAGGVTETDVELARRITGIAAAAGAEVECSSLATVELALDTPEQQKLGPFWAAVLNGEHVIVDDDNADVGDVNQTLPLMWFQRSGTAEPRQRWHLDVWVDPDQIQPRIDAALAAGGMLVRRDHGAMLSDPDGNKVCLCTWQGRD